jgi:hypothetical protein
MSNEIVRTPDASMKYWLVDFMEWDQAGRAIPFRAYRLLCIARRGDA